jgi:hypothetical protein
VQAVNPGLKDRTGLVHVTGEPVDDKTRGSVAVGQTVEGWPAAGVLLTCPRREDSDPTRSFHAATASDLKAQWTQRSAAATHGRTRGGGGGGGSANSSG